jgi:TRAP-type C4-dicarboxylate transport system permease small subunit
MKHKGIFDWVIDSMAFLAGVLLVGAVLIVCLEVCMRYFFLKPQVWTVDVCEYILFIMTFLATPWLLKKGGHVGVDILVERMTPRVQRFLGVFSALSGVLVSGIIVWFSAATTWDCYENSVVVTKTLTVPKFYFLALISLGWLLLLGEFARQAFQHLRRLKEQS